MYKYTYAYIYIYYAFTLRHLSHMRFYFCMEMYSRIVVGINLALFFFLFSLRQTF